MIVDYYFIIDDYFLDLFHGQKIWHTNIVFNSNNPVDCNMILRKVARKYLLYCDKAIACIDQEQPVYIKNRDTSYKTPVLEDMVYIKLASQSISG